MLTLNQTVEIIKNFCSKHLQVNSFYFGDEWERGNEISTSDNTIVYPNVHAVLQGSDNTNDIITRKFLIIVSDIVNKDESNETHVLSDTEQVCYDLLYYLESIANSGEILGFKASRNSSLTDFTEKYDDEVSGWFFEISISSHIGGHSCNLPIAAGNIFDADYIYVGGSTPAGSFEVLIKDQDGNVVQTFNTSGEYVITILSGINQVIGNTSTIITQDIID